MQTRYLAIQQLTQEGLSSWASARALKLHRHAVQQYRTCTRPPQQRSTVRQTSTLTPYQNALMERWRSGCHNARKLWRELVAQGYPGSYHTVARLTGSLRNRGGSPDGSAKALSPVAAGMTAARAAGLVVVRPEHLTSEEHNRPWSNSAHSIPRSQQRSRSSPRSPRSSVSAVLHRRPLNWNGGWPKPQPAGCVS